jgi:FkbM family methyltransferase
MEVYQLNLLKIDNCMLKKILSKYIPTFIKHNYRLKFYPEYKARIEREKELEIINLIPRYQGGITSILGSKIKFIDSASFAFIYDEIFNKEIYKFRTDNTQPYIVDAGANIGLSVLYLKKSYPNAEIVAFEPDEQVFDALAYNVKSFGLTDVELVKKALWNEETTLQFMSEGADGGRVALNSDKVQLIQVPTIRLRKYLNRKVNFLKIDIEGAETTVLEDCIDLLHNVEKLFVEYHSFVDKQQELGKLVTLLEKVGYRLTISSPGLATQQPFMQKTNYLGMDGQLNIYASRQ